MTMEPRTRGFAGVEQCSDAVVLEVGEAVADAFDQVVQRLSVSVADPGDVEVADLFEPGFEGSGELVQLRTSPTLGREMTTSRRVISRKRFLQGTLGATAGALFLPAHVARATPNGSEGSAPQKETVQRVIVLPANVRIRGANIVPRGEVMGSHFRVLGPNIWATMWRTWQWDDWIAPQISDCASLGNTARLWGDTEVVALGLLTRDAYLKRWQQMLDFTAAQGLYVFACGGGRGDFSHSDAVSLYRPWTELLASYPNVLGVDVINEAWSESVSYGHDYSDNVKLVRSLTDTVRSCGLPATASFPMAKSEWWDWDGAHPIYRKHPTAPYWEASDYIDIHVYAKGTPAQLVSTYNFPWAKGKPVIFGEFGVSTRTTKPDERTAFYQMVKQMIAATPHHLGGLAWSTYDVNNENNTYGLFKAPGVPRTEMTSLLEQLPIAR
jgi:hypothetical protein